MGKDKSEENRKIFAWDIVAHRGELMPRAPDVVGGFVVAIASGLCVS